MAAMLKSSWMCMGKPPKGSKGKDKNRL